MKIEPRYANQIIVESEQQGDFTVSDHTDTIRVEATDRGTFRIQITTPDYKRMEFEVIRVDFGKHPRFY